MFKDSLKLKRTAAGWSIAKTSLKTGVPVRTLEDWERGVRTPPAYVSALVLEKLSREIEKEKSGDDTRKWYRIIRTSALFENISDITCGASLVDEDAEVVALFADEESAKDDLAKYVSEVTLERTFYGIRYRLTEWSIEFYTGDEEGEFISGSDYDFCKMQEEFYDSSSKSTYIYRFGKYEEELD